MTHQQFTNWAEVVYGKYMPAMKAEVEAWLSTRDGYFVAALRELALREHPSIYGKPPGVHELEAWKIEAYQRGHTLEAIEASKRSTPLLAAEVEEEYLPADEAIAILRETIEKLAKKAKVNKGKGARDGGET